MSYQASLVPISVFMRDLWVEKDTLDGEEPLLVALSAELHWANSIVLLCFFLSFLPDSLRPRLRLSFVNQFEFVQREKYRSLDNLVP